MDTRHIRTRWAAVGAAVAITLGAGGVGLVSATSPPGAVTYDPIDPCRLADTRAGTDNVGPRNTPIAGPETLVVAAVGNNGNCTGIPATAASLQLNVTALDASATTFLTIWGSGSQPLVSSLNPSPGQPPTPNAVTTGLTAGGAVNIYNDAGTVNVIVDIAGYYTDHTHDGGDIVDESLTGADIKDSTLSSADIQNESGVSWNDKVTVTAAFGTADIVASNVYIRPPSTGYVTVHASLDWFSPTTNAQIRCQITDGDQTIDTGEAMVRDTSPSTSDVAQSLALTQTFAVPKYTGSLFTGQPFRLVCDSIGGNSRIGDIAMTAQFAPSNYAPFGLINPLGAAERLVEGAPTE